MAWRQTGACDFHLPNNNKNSVVVAFNDPLDGPSTVENCLSAFQRQGQPDVSLASSSHLEDLAYSSSKIWGLWSASLTDNDIRDKWANAFDPAVVEQIHGLVLAHFEAITYVFDRYVV